MIEWDVVVFEKKTKTCEIVAGEYVYQWDEDTDLDEMGKDLARYMDRPGVFKIELRRKK